MAEKPGKDGLIRPPKTLADKLLGDEDEPAPTAPNLDGPAQKMQPPRHLSDRVPRSGGPNPDAAILKALNAAEDLIEGYQGWAVDDLEALWRAFTAATDGTAGRTEIRQMFDIAHEIRGQGGTFGFPLITSISDSLCKYLDQRKQLSGRAGDVIRVHILAMKAVFRQQLKGDQGALSKELPTLLAHLRDRADM